MRKGYLAIVMVISILAISCSKSKEETVTTKETVDVACPIVDSVMLTVSYPGRLDASAKVEVVGRVNGLLKSHNFQDGSFVNKGQVLYTIEDSKYRDAVQQASAALASANSTLDYAKNHYEAVKKALESDAVSKMEVSQAESAYHQAEANIRSAKAALETARTNLAYCTVTAPMAGITDATSFDVGNYVSGEGSPVILTTIYKTDKMTGVFSIDDEKIIDLINENGGVTSLYLSHIPLVFSDSLPHKYYGDLNYVAPALNTSTGTLQLKCSIDNPYGELKPGMFVKIDLPYKAMKKAILVKDTAISTDQAGKYLYVVNDSNKVVYTPIEVGPLHNDSLRVVYSGINPTDRYVTKAMLKVRNGMVVDPKVVK